MSPPTECRLLLDPPASGAWNMAVDEGLLDWAVQRGACCWRFYRWAQPTLSLGYFQPYAGRRQHEPSQPCPVVRRLTGGGAILHDAELTYSLALPGHHPLATRRDLLYEFVHGSLIQTLADLGIEARLFMNSTLARSASEDMYGTSLAHRASVHAVNVWSKPAEEPFLCFQRRSPGDVLVGEAKIAGSAQRRRRGAVLQHGSVLLRRSPAAPELPGLTELTGKAVAPEELAARWLEKWPVVQPFAWRQSPLSDEERQRAAILADERYRTVSWTELRESRGDRIVKEAL